MSFALLASRRITLLVGSHDVRPHEGPGALRDALVGNAEEVRLPGLPDDLNPIVLDPARVEAFLGGLERQPERLLRRLEGRFLVLGVEGLGLSLASALEPAAIAAHYELRLPEEEGLVVQPTLRTAVNTDVALAVARRAQAAASAYDREVAELEAKAAPLPERSNARWRRFAAAIAWRMAAGLLAEQHRRWRTMHEAASGAALCWITPPWVGMPRR